MKIISISNRKGGQGKSTVSFNLAHHLSEHNKVLLIDMDSQSSLTHIINLPFSKEVYSVLSGEEALASVVVEVSESLDFLPTTNHLENLDVEFSDTVGRERLLLNALTDALYDYIIIDTNPSVSLALINCLVASTHVIVPVNADYMSYDGLGKFQDVLLRVQEGLNPFLRLGGVVLNSTRNSNHSREIEKLVGEEYKVLASLSHAVAVADSMVAGKPLSGHRNADEFTKLCKEVTDVDF